MTKVKPYESNTNNYPDDQIIIKFIVSYRTDANILNLSIPSGVIFNNRNTYVKILNDA